MIGGRGGHTIRKEKDSCCCNCERENYHAQLTLSRRWHIRRRRSRVIELLIHIGQDTIDLKDKGFNTLVTLNEEFECSQTILGVDVPKIESSGKDQLSQL